MTSPHTHGSSLRGSSFILRHMHFTRSTAFRCWHRARWTTRYFPPRDELLLGPVCTVFRGCGRVVLLSAAALPGTRLTHLQRVLLHGVHSPVHPDSVDADYDRLLRRKGDRAGGFAAEEESLSDSQPVVQLR